jgi:hypothetical protein
VAEYIKIHLLLSVSGEPVQFLLREQDFYERVKSLLESLLYRMKNKLRHHHRQLK